MIFIYWLKAKKYFIPKYGMGLSHIPKWWIRWGHLFCGGGCRVIFISFFQFQPFYNLINFQPYKSPLLFLLSFIFWEQHSVRFNQFGLKKSKHRLNQLIFISIWYLSLTSMFTSVSKFFKLDTWVFYPI